MMTEILGWLSSAMLVATIATQVHRQWKAGHSEGVSKWLFIGQIAASVGFTAYSWLLHSWVFVVTNALMLVNALVGYGIVLRHRKIKERGERSTRQSPEGPSPEGGGALSSPAR